MDEHLLIYIAGTLFSALVGYVIRSFFSNNATKTDMSAKFDLQARDIEYLKKEQHSCDEKLKDVHKRLSSFKLEVSREYVTKEMLKMQLENLDEKLDSILRIIKEKHP